MSLQDAIAGLPDSLVPELRFSDVGSTANYIVGSDLATFQPASGNTFSSDGIREIRFNLANNHYLVP